MEDNIADPKKEQDMVQNLDDSEEDEVDPYQKDIELQKKKLHAEEQATDVVDKDGFDLEKYPVREWIIQFQCLKSPIAFNPVVSGFGVFVLWGFSSWCMVYDDALSTLLSWRYVVSLDFTWLFISTRAVYFFFLLYIAFRFGDIKLGPPDGEPEFTSGSYFMMIFSAGVAVGLFVYGFAEPLLHRDGSSYYTNQISRSQDEKDMFAIDITINNWGVTAWAPYLIVAVCMGLASHKYGLPMTFRSCFYPILGDYTWGWIGDIIDGVTIVTTVAGVCTSLGLGAINVVGGFQYLGWVDSDADQDRLTLVSNLTIWGITVISTMSVLAGLHAGIQNLSQLAFCLGMLLSFLIFLLDDSKFIMNLFVQEIGIYVQEYIIKGTLWTDAFGQLREGEGRAIDNQAAATWWMDGWMIFYQAWWISWAAFVGLFIARISKGRTIREVVLYSLITPVLYGIYWFSIFGGTALRQVRQAEELEKLGLTYYNDSTTFLNPGNDFCYDVPQESVSVPTINEETGEEEDTLIFTNYLPGVTPVCKYESFTKVSYNILHSFSYPDTFASDAFGRALSIIFIIALSIYFATSSDSGSLVVDHLSSNGREKHHWAQRLFWAVTEGAVATALLSAGGSSALSAFQTVSVIAGLPFVFLLTYLLESIWVMCKHAESYPDSTEFVPASLSSNKSEFTFPIYGGIFNIFEYILSASYVNHHRIVRKMDLPTKVQVHEFIKSIGFPFITLYQVLSATYPRRTITNFILVITYTFCFIGWVVCFSIAGAKLNKNDGLRSFGWAFFSIAGVTLFYVRNTYRSRYNLRSNIFGDIASSFFLWPQVLAQLRIQCIELGLPNSDKQNEEEIVEVLGNNDSNDDNAYHA